METPISRKIGSPFIARSEVLAAELKVTVGIEKIYALITSQEFKANHSIEADLRQGIDTIYLTEEELIKLGIAAFFPNQAKDGIVVHWHHQGFIHNPPTLYILKQKLKSFALAAKLDKSQFIKLWDELTKEYESLMAINKKNKKVNQAVSNECVKQFNKNSVAMMEFLLKTMIIKIYTLKVPRNEQKENHFQNYCKDIIAAANLYRSTNSSILVFDEETKTFSFDEVYSATTYHGCSLLSRAANLSIVYEGVYQLPNYFKINSSILKHAVLVPGDAIANVKIDKDFVEDVDVLVSTCNHIEEVANIMIKLRNHGQIDKENILQLDWFYQLLTTNALSSDKPAASYGYIAKAVNLMNGIKLANTTLNVHVINAGINDWAEYNFGLHSDTQNRENVNAYLYLSKNFKRHLQIINLPTGTVEPSYVKTYNQLVLYYEPIDPVLSVNQKFNRQAYELHSDKGFSHNEIKSLKKDYEDRFSTLESLLTLKMQHETELRNIAINFDEAREVYNKCLNTYHHNINIGEQLKLQLGEDGFNRIQSELFHNFKLVKNKIADYSTAANSIILKLEKVNKKLINHSQEYWDINRIKIQEHVESLISDPNLKELIEAMSSHRQEIREAAHNQFFSIAAIVYKSYLDELFYDNRYREPKNAALFNAYLSSYLHTTGLIASAGCNTANDRAYIARLFLATLANQDKKLAPLPAPLHRNLDKYKQFCSDMGKVAFTNSALYSCIDDTSGGTPNVDLKKFKYMDYITSFNCIGQFSKYAACSLLDAYETLMTKIFLPAFKNRKRH